jgi:hypothetical protein
MTETATPERRTTKDGRDVPTSRTLDALRPLIDGVENLERRVDRYAATVEKRRADEADRRLHDLFDGVAERIYAAGAAKERQAKSEAFERRLFGRRLPRNLREKLFGVPDEPEPETLSVRQRIFGK